MKAAIGTEHGLIVTERPVPSPAAGQVLVRVAAAGMNRADLAAATGGSAAQHPGPIGMEWAGTIIAMGDEVAGFSVGDAVTCFGNGGYAEFAVADAGCTIRLDGRTLEVEAAAGLPLVLMTAHDALVTNGRLQSGDAVLINGASTSVGLAGMQIARRMGAARVIGTSTSPERAARLAEFGVERVIDPSAVDWVDQVMAATDGNGVDLAIDMVAGPAISQLMQAMAVRGRIINVGRIGGRQAMIDMDLHALKRLEYIGVTFRTRDTSEVRAVFAAMVTDLWEDVVSGKISIPIDRRYPLAEAPAALEHMRTNQHFGKLVLIP